MTALEPVEALLSAHGFRRAEPLFRDGDGYTDTTTGYTLTVVARQQPTVKVDWRIGKRSPRGNDYQAVVADAMAARNLLRAQGYRVEVPHPGGTTLYVTKESE